MTDKPVRPQARKTSGHLIAFEGLDQSGKQTQAERLLAAFRSAAAAVGCTPLQAAVSFAMSVGEIDAAVLGVTDAAQFAEIIAAAAPTLPLDWYRPFAVGDERILDPSRWPT